MLNKINLAQKFSLFQDLWSPKVVGEMNGQHLKLAKLQGEFVWHDHAEEDELFIVVKGTLFIDFRDQTVELGPGECLVVPKGVSHRPRTGEAEVHVMLLEPKETAHTGQNISERTVNDQPWI